MPLDTLPILTEFKVRQIMDGKMCPVAERAEIEFKEEFGKGDCKLVYVLGKIKNDRIISSTKGKRKGRKYFAGGIGSDLGIWHISDLETYKPLQYKK